MITGFNTDIDHKDRVFHVQTEDKGLSNPQVESLVYCGGEIVASRQCSYADLAESGAFSEDEVLQRMEEQHQAMIREIFGGKFDDDSMMPFGHNIVTNRSLDDVVLEFLRQEDAHEPIRIELVDELELIEGTRPNLRMKVVEDSTSGPVERAQVTVQLISTQGPPRELFSAETDHEGYLEATFDIPEVSGANTALLCEVEALGQRAELRRLIRKP